MVDVLAGRLFQVRAGATNIGDTAGDQDVTLAIDGTVVDTASDVQLGAGERAARTLAWDTTGAVGSHTATIASDNDTTTLSVDVVEATFDVTITGTNSPVAVGETVTVDADVTNTGSVEATVTIGLLDGPILSANNTVDATSLTFGPGDTESVTLETAAPDTEGDVTYFVSPLDAEGTADSVTVTIADVDLAAAHRWPLSEGSGPTAADTVGGQDMTLESGATWQSGSGEGGAFLSGDASNRMATSEAVPATGDDPRTLACWVRLPDGSTDTHWIMGYGSRDQTFGRFTLRTDNNEGNNLRIEAGGENRFWADNLVPVTGGWEPVAVAFDGSDAMLYLDGDTETSSFTTDTDNLGLALGASHSGSDAFERLNGDIDDVWAWDRALSVGELNDWRAETAANH